MDTLEVIYEEALFYDNRGYQDKAKEYYDALYQQEKISIEMIERMTAFYASIQNYSISYELANLGIERKGSLQYFLPFYLFSFQQEGKIDDLDKLLLQEGMEHFISEKHRIAQFYYLAGEQYKAYALSVKLSNKIDRLFFENPSEVNLYIHHYLLMVKMEVGNQNLNQARFHLRKLMYLELSKMQEWDSIAYWTIVLDEVGEWVKRSDFIDCLAHISDNLKLIVTFYYDLMQSKLSRSVVDELNSQVFDDDFLDHKRRMCLRLIHRLQKKDGWLIGIKDDYNAYPHDLLTGILYSTYLEQTDRGHWQQHVESLFKYHSDKAEAISAYWKMSKTKKAVKSSASPDTQITFLGGGEKIGGMSILVTIKGHSILLDAGMHLKEEYYHPDYTPMLEQGITFDDLDALLITHAHLDHTGAVPYVYKQNKQLKMYATEATRRLMKVLLLDSVGHNKDLQGFDEEDVRIALIEMNTVQEEETFIIPSKDSAWKVTYYHSGHILGACAIHLEIDGVTVLFTGDYSIDDQKTVEGLKLPKDIQVDILITESTYGFLPTNASIDRAKQEKLFIDSLSQTLNNGGNLLIPAFAVGRSQEILMIIREAFNDNEFLPFDIYIDGRVVEVCQIYEDMYELQEKKSTLLGKEVIVGKHVYSAHGSSSTTFDDFYEDYLAKGGNCIIASSGMLTDQSASSLYAEKMIDQPHHAISFTGYMDEESPGHNILEMDRRSDDASISINGKRKKVKAKVDTFRLSAHASREQILKLIMDIQPKQVFLVHGEHQKSYTSNQTVVSGHVIYPTLLDLLAHLSSDMKIIPAFNGSSYTL